MRRAFAGVYRSAVDVFARRSELHAEFARYRGPVLCAWGTRDRYIPVRAVRQVRAVYPRAEIVLLDRSGHLPSIEEPARLGAVLRRFLAEDDAASCEPAGDAGGATTLG
ncbi:MAG: hypothetical protein JOZ24_12390 [Candidatus Eremiobacteraeota bacterium]|nr:hypothetical protein [Candidatus Eremiobacteraeota bacterium]